MAQTGAAARAQLAAAARAAGGGRGSGLRPGPSFAQLCEPPAWSTASPEDQDRLGALAALLSVAPSLVSSVDGKVLGPLADAFGDAVLEAALQAADASRAVDAGDAADTPATPEALRRAGTALIGRAAGGDAAAVRLLQGALALPRPAEEDAA